MNNSLWVEKYRPDTVDGYVFKNDSLKNQVDAWIKQGSLPNLLLAGPAGTGKTTLAKILLNAFDVQDSDILYANGSKECRKIEWIDKLIGFCQTMPFGDFKVVLVDEFDYSGQATVMPALRNLMEEYSDSVRFIATCNYPNRIIPALHSRFQTVTIEKSDPVDFTSRVATILVEEAIEFDLDTLDTYVKAAYPDLRKCINTLQLNCSTGKLTMPDSTNTSTSDYRLEMVELFKQGKISQARKLICSQASVEEYEQTYRWLYDNLSIFGEESVQDRAILVIKQGLVDHTICSDPEINFSATMIRLADLING